MVEGRVGVVVFAAAGVFLDEDDDDEGGRCAPKAFMRVNIV